MDRHELDRPAWTALTSVHERFAEGDGRARRYHPAIVPFAASQSDDPEAVAALGKLFRPGDIAVFLQAGEIRLPADLETTMTADGVQMIAEAPIAGPDDPAIVELGPADAEDMLALASLTRPGPFTLRALDIGRFWGLREEGRLLAMAGQRMAHPNHVELSGVCCHPDARGRGFARRLSAHVAAHIWATGKRPYLHAFATNAAAIGLYHSLGFRIRTEIRVAAVQMPA